MRSIALILILFVALSAGLYAIFGGNGNNGAPLTSATNGASQDVAALTARFSTDEMAGFVFAESLAPPPNAGFQGPDGRTYGVGSFRGKVVLLNFWATWCAPCRHEMPSLNDLQLARGGDGFEIVTINVDRDGGTRADGFMQDVGATALTVYREPTNRMAGAYRVIAMPTSVLLDREGREIGRLLGATDWNSAAAHRLLAWAKSGQGD